MAQERQHLLLKYCAGTSAHGIPRALTAKSMLERMIWICLLLCALAVFQYHLSLLVSHYLSKPVNYESQFQGAAFQFPDLYICNPMTVSGSRMDADWNLRIQNYLLRVNIRSIQLTDILRKSPNSSIQYKWLSGYEELELALSFSSTRPEILHRFIISSKEQTIIKTSLNNRKLGLGSFVVRPHREFLFCLQFANTSALTSPKDELTLHLFTDAWPETLSKRTAVTYRGTYDVDMSAGLLLLLTSKGSYPGEGAQRIFLSSGMHTDVTVSMTRRKTINKASRPCSEEQSFLTSKNRLHPVHGDETVTYLRHLYECMEHKWSLVLYDKCHCIPLNYQIPQTLMKDSPRRCLDLWSFNNTEIIKNLLCTNSVLRDPVVKRNVIDSCRGAIACVFDEYTTTSHYALWPSIPLIPWVTNKIIKPTYEERIRQNLSAPGWNRVLERNGYPNLTDIVRNNIVKLTIRPKAERATVWTEVEAYPIFNLFSDIGGILGLYLGMSLLTVSELIALAILFTKPLT